MLRTGLIDECFKIKALPRGIGKLGALTQLTLDRLAGLQAIPDLIGLTALDSLRIGRCPLQDMPCIEALTALRKLSILVSEYREGCRAFTALSRSLPCLQQLEVLHLGCNCYVINDVDYDQPGVVQPLHEYGNVVPVPLLDGDVLEIGRALKAWPLPRLHDVYPADWDPADDSGGEGMQLSWCWRALGLPQEAEHWPGWTNAMTLQLFRVQQQKVVAFASGMHSRLGAASRVSQLDEQVLVMIAEEVLGRGRLVKEWRHERALGACGAETGGGSSEKHVATGGIFCGASIDPEDL